jgi:hypothetical protein
VPFNASLLEFGCKTLSGTITSWWNYWRKRSKEACHIFLELVRAAGRGAPTEISAGLKRWIGELGVDTDSITPGEAKTWVATYQHQKQVTRAHQLPTSAAGPSTTRTKLEFKYRLGRHCYKKQTS